MNQYYNEYEVQTRISEEMNHFLKVLKQYFYGRVGKCVASLSI
jgi:hypothetical protein